MQFNSYLKYLNVSESLKPPYICKDVKRGDLQVWIVDGSYIRGNIDEEFTNFGQHFRFPFIPLLELWLDVEGAPDEKSFFIDHLVVEHKLMSEGKSYGEAIVAADKVEREERRKAGDVDRVTNNEERLPLGEQMHIRLWKKLENGVEVWIVDGRLIRSVFNIDFTAGGHEFVYEFVPFCEVWIDNDIKQYEMGYVALHELHERNRMMEGIPYSKAHEESSALEYYCRHHPDELHDKLADEGWT
jgi:uncharacterized protein YoaH (UPF0181 family)